MVVCSASSYVRSSHGGDEAQRRRASVTVGNGATACKRDGEEGVLGRSSRRLHYASQWARGRVGDGVRSPAISAAERLKTTPWSWCGASGVLRVVQEAWAMVAELPRNTGRREGVGERGGSRRRFHGRVGRRGREQGRGGESELRERGRTRGARAFPSATDRSGEEAGGGFASCACATPSSSWQGRR